jgi:hypothetical protein
VLGGLLAAVWAFNIRWIVFALVIAAMLALRHSGRRP